jgi:hypothetical protein
MIMRIIEENRRLVMGLPRIPAPSVRDSAEGQARTWPSYPGSERMWVCSVS